MKLTAALIEEMAKAGCTVEQIVAVAKGTEAASEEKLARKREMNRIRQQNHRARNALSRVTERDESDAPSSSEVSPQTPLPNSSNPVPPSPPKGGSSPRVELEIALDADRASAVIDHRKRIGKPLTAHAAKLLAGKFSQCADPNAAADEMIANGWQGFKPEWVQRRNTNPSNGKRTFFDVARDHIAGNDHGSESIFGTDRNAELLPPDRRESRSHHEDLRGGIAGRYITSGH